MSSLSIIFIISYWTCVGLIAYSYAMYAPLVWSLSRLIGQQKMPNEIDNLAAPMISLLIVAHNEEAVIEQRLGNALALNYPKDRLEIVVASDGSTDQTSAIVQSFANRGVRLIDFSQRRGKAAAINRVIPQLLGEIVLLSDANTHFDPQAARKLVRWFDNPQVGIVCGRLVLTDPQTGRNVDSVYWRFETMLKRSEAKLGGLLGANGAIYAIRRSFYCPIPDGTIIDDFVIPLLARLRNKCSIVYDVEAIAREETAADVRQEFRRRLRIGTGNFQSLSLLWPLLNPGQGFVAFTFFSHKILRWFCPFLLIGLLASGVALANRPFYGFAMSAQLALYAIAIIALFTPHQFKLPKLLTLAAMFVSMNVALFVGFWRWLTRSNQGAWDPTVRTSLLEKESG